MNILGAHRHKPLVKIFTSHLLVAMWVSSLFPDGLIVESMRPFPMIWSGQNHALANEKINLGLLLLEKPFGT